MCASAFGLSEQAADPANQSLDEGVTGADLAVQTLHLQQLPLQSLSETCCHVALQLHSHKQKTEGSGKVQVVTHICKQTKEYINITFCQSSIQSVNNIMLTKCTRC